MAVFNFGIIGCGMIAEFHTRAINEIPHANLVATYDTIRPAGVHVESGAGNAILTNSIHSNMGGLGIDLGPWWVTTNDASVPPSEIAK